MKKSFLILLLTIPFLGIAQPLKMLVAKKVSSAPAPQNLIKYSQQFTNGVWNVQSTASIVDNSATAPDATTTAALLTAGTDGYSGTLRQGSVTFTAQQYTASVYLKKGNYNYIGLRTQGTGSDTYAFIDLSTNTVSASGLSGVTVGVDVIGSGWVRFHATWTASSGSGFFDITIVNSGGASYYTPTGTQNVYVWGAQLSEGALRAYSATTTSIIP